MSNFYRMRPHPRRAGRFTKKCSTSIHDNTLRNDSLCFYAISGSNKRHIQTAVIEHMKNKNYVTESSRKICNVCLSKVKVEFFATCNQTAVWKNPQNQKKRPYFRNRK